MPDFKLEIIKGLVFMILGAFLALHFGQPKDPDIKPVIAQQQQSQNQSCKIVQVIKKAPDGSSTQTLEISSADLQEQGLSLGPAPSASKKLGVGISLFTDKSLDLSYEVLENISLIGKCSDISQPDKARYDVGVEFRF